MFFPSFNRGSRFVSFPTEFQPHFFRPEDFRSTHPSKDQRPSTVGLLAGTHNFSRLKTYWISTFLLCLVKISFITPTTLPVLSLLWYQVLFFWCVSFVGIKFSCFYSEPYFDPDCVYRLWHTSERDVYISGNTVSLNVVSK